MAARLGTPPRPSRSLAPISMPGVQKPHCRALRRWNASCRSAMAPESDMPPMVGGQRRTLRILPVYPASAKAGLTSWELGTFIEEALGRAGTLVDPLPAE